MDGSDGGEWLTCDGLDDGARDDGAREEVGGVLGGDEADGDGKADREDALGEEVGERDERGSIRPPIHQPR